MREAFEAKLAEEFEISRWSPSSSEDEAYEDDDEVEKEEKEEEGEEGEDNERQSNEVEADMPETSSQSPSRQTETSTQPQDEDCEITASIFVGRPLLRITDPPPRGCLSCLVFSSTFPKYTLPDPFKNKADMAIDCCRVLSSIEEEIVRSSEYRCAICSELVKATCLLHHPISFSAHWESDTIRRAVMAMFQFVKGSWSFPETELVFGVEKHAHIFDFAVPVCAPGTICEDVARTAAREFIKLVLPENLHMQFPGLDPDIDLPSLRDGLGWARNDPQLVLQKIATQGFMDEEANRGEDPRDDTLTIAKLRHWHEICFNQELAKRRFLRENGYKRAGDIADSESSNTEADPEFCIATGAERMDASLPLEQSPTSTKSPHTEDVQMALHNRPLLPLPNPDDAQEAYQSRPLPPLPAIGDEIDETAGTLDNLDIH
ncbi:hypothetical protein Plec18167_007518 [Paecilomyces lecythidis]|uniref:Uncharacterized protein n=1 Tax=Paecilomyces lecythidis TaxID=3004212 RepID=A0ABR3X371_9EURO